MKSIFEEYVRKHSKSNKLYEEAKTAFPSGVTHDVRHVKPFPIFITHGQGPRKWDIDGNEYICYVMGHGALILGHSHPEIVTAVKAQITKGTHLGANTELELGWANSVKKMIYSIEKIRFFNSGTEATLMALRLARAFTGKNKSIKFEQHFHGWHDYLIAEPGRISSRGIPAETSNTVIRLQPGNIEIVEETLQKDKNIAGVILEPTGALMGCLPIKPEFLTDLREVTKMHGVVLIFDEVVTGFRISSGGAQTRFQINPDLTTLAKILGGGLPGGAVGGKAEILNMISFHEDTLWNTSQRVSHSGTFNANPLCAAAGLRCLEMIRSMPINRKADKAAEHLKSGFNEILERYGIPGIAYGLSSLVWVVFGTQFDYGADLYSLPHRRIKEALFLPLGEIFKRALLNEGVDIMGTSEFIVSATHCKKDIDVTLEAFESAINWMKNEDVFSTLPGN